VAAFETPSRTVAASCAILCSAIPFPGPKHVNNALWSLTVWRERGESVIGDGILVTEMRQRDTIAAGISIKSAVSTLK